MPRLAPPEPHNRDRQDESIAYAQQQTSRPQLEQQHQQSQQSQRQHPPTTHQPQYYVDTNFDTNGGHQHEYQTPSPADKAGPSSPEGEVVENAALQRWIAEISAQLPVIHTNNPSSSDDDQPPPSDDEEAQRQYRERYVATLPVLHTNNDQESAVTPSPARTYTRQGNQGYVPPVHAHTNHHWWYSAPPVYIHQHRPIIPQFTRHQPRQQSYTHQSIRPQFTRHQPRQQIDAQCRQSIRPQFTRDQPIRPQFTRPQPRQRGTQPASTQGPRLGVNQHQPIRPQFTRPQPKQRGTKRRQPRQRRGTQRRQSRQQSGTQDANNGNSSVQQSGVQGAYPFCLGLEASLGGSNIANVCAEFIQRSNQRIALSRLPQLQQFTSTLHVNGNQSTQQSSVQENHTQSTQSYYEELYYDNQTSRVKDISNLSSDEIRQYLNKNKYRYQHGGDLHNLHVHIENTRLSVSYNEKTTNAKCCVLCEGSRMMGVTVKTSLRLCTLCYKTYVTALSYEEIFAKEVIHNMPEFKHKECLPYPTLRGYELDMYRITEESFEHLEIDGKDHVVQAMAPSRRYVRDALRSKHISEENDICAGTCHRLVRIFHDSVRVPSCETVEFVVDLFQNEFSDVPGGHYNHTKDLVLLLNYDINNYRACLQVRRYISVYGINVVRVLRYAGTQFVNVDLTSIVHNQIMGK